MQVDVVAAPVAAAGAEQVQIDPASRGTAEKDQQQATVNTALQTGNPGLDEANAAGHQLLSSAVGQMDKLLQTFDDAMRIRIDHDTGKPVVTVYNQKTGQVIRQIPNEKVISMVSNFQQQLAGLFVDSAQ